MAQVEHKKVELVELFFDLVLVYAISRTTGLVHHLAGAAEPISFGGLTIQLAGGIIEPMAFGSFLIALIIVANAWMYQAVFTSRYGSNSIRDMAFSFITMVLLLFLSNTITEDWEATFVPFTATLGLIFVVQFVQYLLTYLRKRDSPSDRFLISGFLFLTGIYAATLLIGAALPYRIGIWFSMVGLVVNLILPAVFEKRLHATPLNFPHIVERLTLLVIITFGEMIVGIAAQFTLETTSVWSVLIFIIALGMFLHYILHFDYMIDLTSPYANTFRIEYAHFPILVGLGMMTVSFSFLMSSSANVYFAIVFLYAGMILFYGGEFFARVYKKPQFAQSGKTTVAQIAIIVVAILASFVVADLTGAASSGGALVVGSVAGRAAIAIAAVCTIAVFGVSFGFYRAHRGEPGSCESFLAD